MEQTRRQRESEENWVNWAENAFCEGASRAHKFSQEPEEWKPLTVLKCGNVIITDPQEILNNQGVKRRAERETDSASTEDGSNEINVEDFDDKWGTVLEEKANEELELDPVPPRGSPGLPPEFPGKHNIRDGRLPSSDVANEGVQVFARCHLVRLLQQHRGPFTFWTPSATNETSIARLKRTCCKCDGTPGITVWCSCNFAEQIQLKTK